MRRLLIASFLVVPFAFGQQESETAWDVKYLMEAERYGGRHIKILWWAGDQTAVEMRKLYDDDFLAQPRNLRKVLGILEAAFGNLEQVRYAEDKEPRASISLLRSVQQKVSDPRYKTAIDELIDKLRVPEAIEADSGCIDPLALPMIPISSRKQAPDLALRDFNDKPFRLSDDKGRPIIVNIWDSNSQPQAAGLTFRLPGRFGMSGLAVVGVWEDAGGRTTLDTYLNRAGMAEPDYPVVPGRGDISQAFGAGPLPIVVLIDRSGKIAALQSSDGTGFAPLSCTYDGAIKALLAEPASVN